MNSHSYKVPPIFKRTMRRVLWRVVTCVARPARPDGPALPSWREVTRSDIAEKDRLWRAVWRVLSYVSQVVGGRRVHVAARLVSVENNNTCHNFAVSQVRLN